MTVRDAATLKSYFNTGDVPTEQQYVDLIDTIFAQGGGPGGGDTVSEGPGIDIVSGADKAIGIGGDTILLHHANGDPVSEYAATDAGLTSALAAMSSGDWLETPQNSVFANSHTLVADCKFYFYKSIFNNTLTMASGCRIYGGLISVTKNSGFAVGVYNPGNGVAILHDTEIESVNTNGEAAAFYLQSTGDLIFHNCILKGIGTVNGWSGYDGAGGGTAYLFDCNWIASSAPNYFNV